MSKIEGINRVFSLLVIKQLPDTQNEVHVPEMFQKSDCPIVFSDGACCVIPAP